MSATKLKKDTVEGMRVIKRAHQLDEKATERVGRAVYKTLETAPSRLTISQTLYDVVDMDGTHREMTKRQAKKAYSPRQVRRALKQTRRNA